LPAGTGGFTRSYFFCTAGLVVFATVSGALNGAGEGTLCFCYLGKRLRRFSFGACFGMLTLLLHPSGWEDADGLLSVG